MPTAKARSVSTDATRAVTRAVTRALCVSVSRVKGSAMSELLAIRNRACARECPAGVRVSLLYTSGWFVLWAEGDKAGVEETLRRAAADPRNENQKVLHMGEGARTLAEKVLVAATQSPLGAGAFARRVGAVWRDRAHVAEPAVLWQSLAEPSPLAQPEAWQLRPGHDLAFVAAEDHGPIDQLRRIAERVQSPVVYQRFGAAKSHTSDVGAAYVDVPLAEGAVRVRLVSRKSLGHPLVRASLARAGAIVPVLGARPAASIELASAVADCVKALHVRPEIHFAGADAEVVAACSRLVARSGVEGVGEPLPPASTGDLAAMLPALGLAPQPLAQHARAA